MLDVTPDNVSVPVAPAVAAVTKDEWLIVPDIVGVWVAATMDIVREVVLGPLLALGDVLALILTVTLPLGALEDAVTVNVSFAATPLLLLNVR